jgi:hypothetical protein
MTVEPNNEYLQGRVKFPTGGIVREPNFGMNRCDSGTDSRVWMEEDASEMIFFDRLKDIFFRAIFYF